MGVKRNGNLSWNKQKQQWQRTLGRYRTASGRTDGKKFLLGADREAAEIAVARLVRLWENLVAPSEKENEQRQTMWELETGRLRMPGVPSPKPYGIGWLLLCDQPPRPRPERVDPLWDDQHLEIARQVIAGSSRILVPPAAARPELWDQHLLSSIEPGDLDWGAPDQLSPEWSEPIQHPDEPCYATQVQRFAAVLEDADVIPAERKVFEQALGSAGETREIYEKITSKLPINTEGADPRGGQTLHGALDRYAEVSFEEHDNPNARSKNRNYGDRKRRCVLSLKACHSDLPLAAVDVDAIR